MKNGTFGQELHFPLQEHLDQMGGVGGRLNDGGGIPQSSDRISFDQIKVGRPAINSIQGQLKPFFQCQDIFVPLWRRLFPKLGNMADQVNIGADGVLRKSFMKTSDSVPTEVTNPHL